MAQCVPCAPGTANPLTGMTACIPCLVGRGMGFLLGRPGFESLDADVGRCWMVNDTDHFQITFRSLSRLSHENWNSGLVGRSFHEHLWSTAV